MSPSPAAPNSASATACMTTSASECPKKPKRGARSGLRRGSGDGLRPNDGCHDRSLRAVDDPVNKNPRTKSFRQTNAADAGNRIRFAFLLPSPEPHIPWGLPASRPFLLLTFHFLTFFGKDVAHREDDALGELFPIFSGLACRFGKKGCRTGQMDRGFDSLRKT